MQRKIVSTNVARAAKTPSSPIAAAFVVVCFLESETEKRSYTMIVILVAKHPTKGKSKTRLAKCVGDEMALKFANAMLDDTIERLGEGEGERVLYYAPASEEKAFEERCERLNLSKKWSLMPMPPTQDLKSKSLTDLLKHALIKVRRGRTKENVACFCGMDSPTLSLKTILNSARIAENGKAHIVPANDGGYVLLSLPSKISPSVFENVVWSSDTTTQSQCDQIRRLGVDVETSNNVHLDIDEAHDLALLKRECDGCENIRDGCPRTYKLLKKMFERNKEVGLLNARSILCTGVVLAYACKIIKEWY